jgi:hypothetical protein
MQVKKELKHSREKMSVNESLWTYYILGIDKKYQLYCRNDIEIRIVLEASIMSFTNTLMCSRLAKEMLCT